VVDPIRQARALATPSGAALALLCVLPAVPVLGYLAASHPTDALALVLAAIVAAALLSNLTVGVCIFVAVQFALPIFPVGALAKFLGFALVARWLVEITLPNPGSRLKSFARQYPVIATFVAASLVYSLITAVWAPAPSIAVDTLSRYALNTVLLATIFAACRSRTAIRWIGAAIAIGGALTVALLLIVGTNVDTTRLTDAAVDANELAMVLIASIFFGCLLAIQSRAWYSRLAFAGVAGLSFCGLLLTNSRGGFVAIICALLAWIVVGGRWRSKLLFGAVIALVSATAYLAIVAPAEQRTRVYEVIGIGSHPVDRSGTGRTSIWTVGWRAFKDRPLEGFGYGNFPEVTPHYLLRQPGLLRDTRFILHPLVAHNTYLQSLVEVGILGSLLFFTPIAGALVAFIIAARRFQRVGNEELELFARTGFAVLVGVLVASFFLSEGLAKILWVLIGLAFGLCDLGRPEMLRRTAG
jgi:O-antigen ligase